MPLKLLACQVLVPPVTRHDEKLAHIQCMIGKIDKIVSESSVDIVVLPELCTIDYSRETFSRLPELAEPIEGPTAELFSNLARRHHVHVVFGMPRAESDSYYISQVVIGPDGAIKGYYDKIHVAQFGASMEKEFFERGRHLLAFDVKGYRIAPIICYDIRVPELTRTLCMTNGAELILHCGAYARDESFYSWHHFSVTRAMENMVHFLSLNRAGSFYGSSIFCRPWMDENQSEIVLSNEETFRVFSVDKAELENARATYPFLKDRLDNYGLLERREIP
jgi:omega-amidase